jgi:phage terminase Nu1 subunit (DNA packaging protein)
MAVIKGKNTIDAKGIYVLEAGTPVFVKTADICAITGKTNQWIGQLTSQGVINKTHTSHGQLYNVRDTMQAYLAMLNDRAVDEDTAELEHKKLLSETALKQSKATIAAYEAKEIQGKMHRSEDVAAMTEDMVYTIRSALLSLPGRIALDVSGAETPAEASDIVRKEIFQIMEELSRYEYDPVKYEERVRERRKWEEKERVNSNDES